MRRFLIATITSAMLFPAAVVFAVGNGVLPIKQIRHPDETAPGQNFVFHRCLAPRPGTALDLGLERDRPWSLPKRALAAQAQDTLHCLVLRYNFQYEGIDDPNTTGCGHMILDDPLATPADSAAYFDSAGHWIDPPPHDSMYFDAHMRALARYWEVVSDGKLTLSWDIFPPGPDSVYTLAFPMSQYGRCHFSDVIAGLEQYFVDCLQLADAASPEIDFSSYQSIFLFHAGSDRQNDRGFPPTCHDLFTGFIVFGDSLAVDNDSTYVRTALMMPEMTNQDNRATAMNAVMAHEFGHQLGLVDLYSTYDFRSRLGDFALMDNNGFGTNIDFGFPVGGVYGAIPLFPCAWSRAYLGFVEVHDFRQGTGIRLAAAQMQSEGIKVARIPISENEYYLLENRLVEYDGVLTGVRQDSATSVIQGPIQIIVTPEGDTIAGDYTREYDALMPGSGMLIFHVDESVAAMDFDDANGNNFQDNQLQWFWDYKFISLVEADGIIDFHDDYRSGYGSPNDMYRDDRNTAFTPNTNPPSIDNTGNNTHVRITGITRDKDTLGTTIIVHDSLMLFDLETEGLVNNFPVRVGIPLLPLAAIAVDLNRDGTDEIVAASSNRLLAFTTDGENYLTKFFGSPDSLFMDSARGIVHTGGAFPLPMFGLGRQPIQAGPVAGHFGDQAGPMLVAVGRDSQVIEIRLPVDRDANGLADSGKVFRLDYGNPISMIFDDRLFILTDAGGVYRLDSLPAAAELIAFLAHDQYHGLCRLGDGIVLAAGDQNHTIWYAIESSGAYDSIAVDGEYRFGPICVDVDRNGAPEIVGLSANGDGILITADINASPPNTLSVKVRKSTGVSVTTNPVAADVDGDGFPEIVVGGVNQLIAFDRNLTRATDYPLKLDDRFPESDAIAAPIVADVRRGGKPELIVPTESGNIYAFGDELAYGFPLSGGEITAGSALVLHDSLGGMLGYLGADGWFYLWHTDLDTTRDFWPMAGADAGGTLVFDESKLRDPSVWADDFDEKQFYNYPNPVTDGMTTIRYFLGRDAERVVLTVFDLSGREVAGFGGPTAGGVNNELEWSCADLTPGIYRCRIEIDFGGESQTGFTDIAILR